MSTVVEMTTNTKQLALQLTEAVIRGDAAFVKEILKLKVNPSITVRLPGWGKTCALKEAIRHEQFQIASFLLTSGADIHFEDANGDNITTASIDVYEKRLKDESQRLIALKLVKQLLAAGGKPNPRCLVLAAGHADLSMIRLLLAHGMNVNATKLSNNRLGRLLEPQGETALARAVDLGFDSVAVELLRLGANPDVDDSLGVPCLHKAVAKDRRRLVKAFLKANADLNRRGTVPIGEIHSGTILSGERKGDFVIHTSAQARDATPLIVAVRCKNLSMVRFLVKGGANIEGKDGEGLTALAWAIRLKHESIAACLRKQGASVAELEGSPAHRLYNAAAFGDLEKLRAALGAGADVNGFTERRGTNYTPLMRAARAGKLNVVGELLSAGADPDLGGHERFGKNITPLMLAARGGHKEIVEALLRAGAKVDIQAESIFGHRGWGNAVRFAKEGQHDEVVRVLRTGVKSPKPGPTTRAAK